MSFARLLCRHKVWATRKPATRHCRAESQDYWEQRQTLRWRGMGVSSRTLICWRGRYWWSGVELLIIGSLYHNVWRVSGHREGTLRHSHGRHAGWLQGGTQSVSPPEHLLKTSWKPPENLFYTSWTDTADDLAQGGGRIKQRFWQVPRFLSTVTNMFYTFLYQEYISDILFNLINFRGTFVDTIWYFIMCSRYSNQIWLFD